MTAEASEWGPGILEEGREDIVEWRENRIKTQARHRATLGLTDCEFSLGTIKTFIRNFSWMILLHIISGTIMVYLCKRYGLYFDIQLSLLISPIVFPLAFSINTDFQRRDLVLQYIAHFESSAMILYLCLREWRKDTGFDLKWLRRTHSKLRSILFLLREYLFTGADECRDRILRAMYEDFSDVSLIIEGIRTSKLPATGPLISRLVHLLNVMCLSFERLRVVKEYRSPRSIRAFNKVLITILPVFMAPYFVYLGRKTSNEWSPYLISIVISFIFSSLQGVQDKLDDPFDGLGEDDIKMNAIEEWTLTSFEHTAQRLNVGKINTNFNLDDFSGKVDPNKPTSNGACMKEDTERKRCPDDDINSSTHTVTSSVDSKKDGSTGQDLSASWTQFNTFEIQREEKVEKINPPLTRPNQHSEDPKIKHRNHPKNSRESRFEKRVSSNSDGSLPYDARNDRNQNPDNNYYNMTHNDQLPANFQPQQRKPPLRPQPNHPNEPPSENNAIIQPSKNGNILYYNIKAVDNSSIEKINTLLERGNESENPKVITVAKIVTDQPKIINKIDSSQVGYNNNAFDGKYENDNCNKNQKQAYGEAIDNRNHYSLSTLNGDTPHATPRTLPPLRRDKGVLSNATKQPNDPLPSNIFCVYSSDKNDSKYDLSHAQQGLVNQIDMGFQNEIDDPTSIAYVDNKYQMFGIDKILPGGNQGMGLGDLGIDSRRGVMPE